MDIISSGKRGFTVIHIVIIMSSLVFLLLVLLEASAASAAGSIAETVCASAGRSVLTEFEPALYGRYGILAMRSSSLRSEQLASYYLSSSLSGDSTVVRLAPSAVTADHEEYPALSTELFAVQIRQLGLIIAAKEALDETNISSFISRAAAGASRGSSVSLSGIREQLDSMKEEKEGGGGGSPRKREQAARLSDIVKRGEEDKNARTSFSGKLTRTADLPSRLLGYGTRSILLISGGIADMSSDALFEDEYMVNVLSNCVNGSNDGVLRLECEYLMYGKSSDAENEKAVRRSLFALRMTANLAGILADAEKFEQVTAAAETIFFLIPLPIAVLAIASAWAGFEAKEDIRILFSGGCVPFVKSRSDWNLSLDELFSNRTAAQRRPAAGRKRPLSGCYEDYLRFLLALVPRSEKLARLMDVIESNVRLGGSEFRFTDYSYGFSLRVEFERRSLAPPAFSPGMRKTVVEHVHAYVIGKTA